MTQPGGPADDVRRPSGASGGLDDLLAAGDEGSGSAHSGRPAGPRETLLRVVRDVRVQVAAGVVAALVLGVVVGGLLFGGAPAPVAAPAPTARPSATLPTIVPTGPVTPEVDAPAPVAIAIPDLSIDQAMIPLGVTADRRLEVPTEWMDIGWWQTGPAPGESGGAVIAGHVNGDGKPAVFAELPTLEVGAEVDVRREDGSVATFVVRSKEQFPKDDFPNERMYTFDGSELPAPGDVRRYVRHQVRSLRRQRRRVRRARRRHAGLSRPSARSAPRSPR